MCIQVLIIEGIIPKEKDFGKANTFRIVGHELWVQIDSNMKDRFEDTKLTGKGKIWNKP